MNVFKGNPFGGVGTSTWTNEEYSCLVGACFSSPFEQRRINSHDVKQMVADDVIGQIKVWQPSTWFNKVQ